MPKVNPEILVWARETAGLVLGEAARKLCFRDTRKRRAKDRLNALEMGEDETSAIQMYKPDRRLSENSEHPRK